MGIVERKARQREGTRQEILDAARELFVHEGYANVSMRKIAEKAEYAPGTIYLYFRDKSEILESLCEETFAKLHKRLENIEKDSADLLDGLRRALESYIRFGLENPSHYIVTYDLPQPQHEHDEKTHTMGFQCFAKLQGVVQKGIEAGILDARDPQEIAQTLWAGIHGVTALLLTHSGFPFIEQTRLIESVVRTLLGGVRRR
jgi:AcrR family transcriptional regulator